jgi:hypothetical protein
MAAPDSFLALAGEFVNCFTNPGFRHFAHFVLVHTMMWGPHYVAEALRQTKWHAVKHWTTPYVLMNRNRWSCGETCNALFALIRRLLPFPGEVVAAIDDTLVRKWGRRFSDLDVTPIRPTRIRAPRAGGSGGIAGWCWRFCGSARVASGVAFLSKRSCSYPSGRIRCQGPFQTKIELAVWLIERLQFFERLTVVEGNLYAKPKLATVPRRPRPSSPDFGLPDPHARERYSL